MELTNIKELISYHDAWTSFLVDIYVILRLIDK